MTKLEEGQMAGRALGIPFFVEFQTWTPSFNGLLKSCLEAVGRTPQSLKVTRETYTLNYSDRQGGTKNEITAMCGALLSFTTPPLTPLKTLLTLLDGMLLLLPHCPQLWMWGSSPLGFSPP
jgi:hypothetical protein